MFEGHKGNVDCLGITSDYGIVVSGSDDGTVRVWDFNDKVAKMVFEGHNNCVTNVEVTSDNRFVVSGSDDNTIRVWNLKLMTKHFVVKIERPQIYTKFFMTKNPNKIFIVSALGVETLNISKKNLRQKMFFDQNFEETYYKNSNFQALFCHSIVED